VHVSARAYMHTLQVEMGCQDIKVPGGNQGVSRVVEPKTGGRPFFSRYSIASATSANYCNEVL
jgi:hypothetical protein